MAIDFEVSSSQWVDVGAELPALNAKSAATYMAWVKIESAVATMGIMSFSISPPPGNDSQGRMAVEVRSDRLVRTVIRADDNVTRNGESVTALTVGTWHHIASAVDIANDEALTYIDGVLDVTDSLPFVPTAFLSSDSDLAGIASRSNGSSEFLDGLLDDVRVYSRMVATAEILTIFTARGTDGIVNGLEHRYLFNEGAEGVTASGVGTAKDLGPNTFNAEPKASPVYEAGILRFRRKVA